MSLLMVAGYCPAYMNFLYSFLIALPRITLLTCVIPQVEVRGMDLFPLHTKYFLEMNRSLSEQLSNPFPKNRVAPFYSLAKLELFRMLFTCHQYVALCTSS